MLLSLWHVRLSLNVSPPYQPVCPKNLASCGSSAEVILFVLVGAAVDIRHTLKAGLPALLMILAALVFRARRSASLHRKTNLTWKERLFCAIAYLPKATVQASHRLSSFSRRTRLRTDSAFRSCARNHSYRSAWRTWN